MAQKRLKRPRDPIQLGKLIVHIATGQVEDREANQQKNPKRSSAKTRKQGSKDNEPLYIGSQLKA
jgi:hypothetical protein